MEGDRTVFRPQSQRDKPYGATTERVFRREECCAIYVLSREDGSQMSRSRRPYAQARRSVARSAANGGKVQGLTSVMWFIGIAAVSTVFELARELVEDGAGIPMTGDPRSPIYDTPAQALEKAVRYCAMQRGFAILRPETVLNDRDFKAYLRAKHAAIDLAAEEKRGRIHLGGKMQGKREASGARAWSEPSKYF